jgi:hypothetical protein
VEGSSYSVAQLRVWGTSVMEEDNRKERGKVGEGEADRRTPRVSGSGGW